jgi:hypothetical protein
LVIPFGNGMSDRSRDHMQQDQLRSVIAGRGVVLPGARKNVLVAAQQRDRRLIRRKLYRWLPRRNRHGEEESDNHNQNIRIIEVSRRDHHRPRDFSLCRSPCRIDAVANTVLGAM